MNDVRHVLRARPRRAAAGAGGDDGERLGGGDGGGGNGGGGIRGGGPPPGGGSGDVDAAGHNAAEHERLARDLAALSPLVVDGADDDEHNELARTLEAGGNSQAVSSQGSAYRTVTSPPTSPTAPATPPSFDTGHRKKPYAPAWKVLFDKGSVPASARVGVRANLSEAEERRDRWGREIGGIKPTLMSHPQLAAILERDRVPGVFSADQDGAEKGGERDKGLDLLYWWLGTMPADWRGFTDHIEAGDVEEPFRYLGGRRPDAAPCHRSPTATAHHQRDRHRHAITTATSDPTGTSPHLTRWQAIRAAGGEEAVEIMDRCQARGGRVSIVQL